MHNQLTNPHSSGRQNDLQELYDRLAGPHRLAVTDKPIFARNLGDLAARLSPENPLEGARRIVMHSGNESLWPTKRKKFFRLPGEDAPAAGKDGDYGSYPIQFRKLAEAAGELLCKSNKPELIQNWKMQAIKSLATGSSFMPTFLPVGISTQSAKDLLDEYATVLAEAVKSRTKITELWEILANTPIGLEIDEEISGPYGDAAIFPRSLLTPMYRNGVKSGRLTTTSAWADDEWSKPCLHIGSVAFPAKMRIFCIPEDKRHLFACKPGGDRRLPIEALEWLQSAGFDLEERRFPGLSAGDDSFGWRDAQAHIILEAGLSITHDGDAQPKVEIHLWGDMAYAANLIGNDSPKVQSNIEILTSNNGMTQTWCMDALDLEGLEVVYDRPFIPSKDTEAAAIGLAPPCWQLGEGAGEWTAPDIWIDDDPNDGIYANNYTRGWTEERFIAKLLMSDETEFHPIIPESDPIGGVLPSGSMGASLLRNAHSASSANRITQLLIDKVALTAETGLRFYEAMVDDYRSAINRI